MHGYLRLVPGALCHIKHSHNFMQSFLRTKLMEFLLLYLLLWRSQGTERNKEKACDSSLLGNKAADKGR